MVYLLLKLKYLEIEYKNQYIYIYTHTVYITYTSQLATDRINRDRTPRVVIESIGSTSQPRAGWRTCAPACPARRRSTPRSRNEPTRLDRVDLPRMPHVTQPFFLVVHSFYYIVNYFTITNSANFARVNSAILSHILEIFSQSFS
jgi:hypothetical protein